MKFSKHSILVFFCVLIFSCNSDDVNNSNQEFEATNLQPTITTDIDADTGANINNNIDGIFIEFTVPNTFSLVYDPYFQTLGGFFNQLDLEIINAEDELDVNIKYDIRVLI